jgi:hypothetical protein
MNPTWTPALEFGIPKESPLDTEPDERGLPWVMAPADSHLWGFRFYDARKFSFLRKFGADVTRGKSQLEVRFKDAKGRLASEYTYYFDDHDRGLEFFEAMRSAAHPGEVVQELIRQRVPYRKQAQFS